MKTLLLLALVGLAVAADYATMFSQWKEQYGKTYTGFEHARRFKIFVENAKYVEEFNREGHSWTVGLNKFADITNEEYRQLYLSAPINHSDVKNVNGVGSVTPVDWRTKGAVTAVKDQGQCGSCWAFSSTGGIEGCVFQATGTLQSISEQQLVDCAYLSYGNLGCSGGTQDNAFDYVKAKGLELEADYPYKAERGTCAESSSKFVSFLSGYTDITKGSESALQTSIVARPTPVSIDASAASFQLYKSGIYCPTGCSTTSLDHAVLAVGQDTSAGEDYYIVKNSWGTSWGQEGYIWMCANKENHCGIATAATYPTGCSKK